MYSILAFRYSVFICKRERKNKWHMLNTVRQRCPLNLTHSLRVFPLGCWGSWLMYGLYDNKLPFNVTDMSNLKYSQHTLALSVAKTHPESQSMSLALTSHVKVMSHFSSVAVHKRLTKSLSNICATPSLFLLLLMQIYLLTRCNIIASLPKCVKRELKCETEVQLLLSTDLKKANEWNPIVACEYSKYTHT